MSEVNTAVPMVIASIEHWSHATPEAIALQRGLSEGKQGGGLNSTQSLTFAALWQRINMLAEQLRSHDVKVLSLAGDNHPQWLCADLAAFMADIVLIPIPTFFSPQQVQHILQNSGADHLLTALPVGESENAFSDVVENSFDLGNQLYLQPLHSTFTSTSSLKQKTTRHPLDEITKVTYTSGSTGQPKGVCLSAKVIDRICLSLTTAIQVKTPFDHLCTLPLATLLENVAGAYCALIKGQRCLIPLLTELGFNGSSQLDLSVWMDVLCRYQPGTLILTPELLKMLILGVSQATAGEALETSPLTQLRFIAVGGGKVSAQMIRQVQALQLPVFEGYGLSECGSVVAVNLPGQSRPGSVGKPLLPESVSISEDGEILAKGTHFKGYLDDILAQPDTALNQDASQSRVRCQIFRS